ncbi:OmpP1/FadL family transporter [Flavobacterium enshiense]|uniref:Membrane protein n=1 Tax=Flavobacterium enshiense DK69 TaxID=1107311 RepID=A0A0A2N4F1_9FLAO|nr:membrane protein [Flavobacterium enshiense]KGO95305.1 membrane protein [Flavobacterium enshiense DK69]
MIKKIILGISLLFSAGLLAQESVASPYSFYGIGDAKFKGTNENRAMGSVGVFVDSIHINLQNPASYSFLKYTSLAIGATNVKSTFKTDSQEEKANRTSIDYLAIGLPIGKAAVGFGLVPYTSVGYNVQNVDVSDEDTRTSTYEGEGGLNKVFLGGAYKITPKLSFGVDFQYNFGTVETSSVVFITEPQVPLGSRAKNKTIYSGFGMVTGLYYQTKLQNKLEWSSSLTYTPPTNLNAEKTRNVATVSYTINGTEIVNDNEDIEVPDAKIKTPSKVSLGTAFGKSKKWFVGTEFTFQDSNDLGSQDNLPGASFESSTRFAVGGFYIPKYNSFTSYFDRVVYRAGFRYENTGLVLNDKTIRDTAVSLGFGFPVGTNISNINIGLEYGKKGTTSNNLIQENYFSINVGLSLSDRWFVKPKYD